MKRMIFHVPYAIDVTRNSASHIRPNQMLCAFKENGFKVDVICGCGRERNKRIKYVERNIKLGLKYEFCYSESSTMPTLLTEKHHFPTYPNLDFKFFKRLKENDIKILLFYRDFHWIFPELRQSLGFFKKNVTNLFYCYDIYKYNKLIDCIFFASERAYQYFKNLVNLRIENVRYLPPGLNKVHETRLNEKEIYRNNLHFFYVGGLGQIYNLTKLLKYVSSQEKIKLTICCRKNEWKNMFHEYEGYLTENVTIIHGDKKTYSEFIKSADIAVLFLEPNNYFKLASPYKLYEYMSFGKPILAVKDTASGDFVEKEDIGWSIEYSEVSISNWYNRLKKKDIIEKMQQIEKKKNDHTWQKRAEYVNKIVEYEL